MRVSFDSAFPCIPQRGARLGAANRDLFPPATALPSDETRPHRPLLFRLHQDPSALSQLQAVARIDEQRLLEGRTGNVDVGGPCNDFLHRSVFADYLVLGFVGHGRVLS